MANNYPANIVTRPVPPDGWHRTGGVENFVD